MTMDLIEGKAIGCKLETTVLNSSNTRDSASANSDKSRRA